MIGRFQPHLWANSLNNRNGGAWIVETSEHDQSNSLRLNIWVGTYWLVMLARHQLDQLEGSILNSWMSWDRSMTLVGSIWMLILEGKKHKLIEVLMTARF